MICITAGLRRKPDESRLELDVWAKEVQGMRNSGNVLRQTHESVRNRVG